MSKIERESATFQAHSRILMDMTPILKSMEDLGCQRIKKELRNEHLQLNCTNSPCKDNEFVFFHNDTWDRMEPGEGWEKFYSSGEFDYH